MANQFSGDFSLKEVTLYSVYNTNPTDIKNLVLEISLYESVMSSALQAEILIQDIGEVHLEINKEVLLIETHINIKFIYTKIY